ncbi:unnamed protein product [Kluyveromyces dobzhanskii CBS 2104]|uniref:WGS project CCBQ000000000 data, contig 00015 n=1 Tax=Kluyveromyces dobzhanskii CBS 2104 TaxID=1427455 RepID=A0A0A8LBB0_9SACH|nr:unnamed protein product [Kluyveromyces dobzhanskii CBS 2104]
MISSSLLQTALVLGNLLTASSRFVPASDGKTSSFQRESDELLEMDVLRQNSLMHQLYGDLLVSNNGEDVLSKANSQPFIKVHPDETDEEFKGMCSFYNENRREYPNDDFYDDLLQYAGIVTFGHTEFSQCFKNASLEMDIAIVGAPFDTAVSYRPGARFGPNGIRQGSRRLGNGISPVRGFPGSKLRKLDPFNSGYKIVDCGDIPMTPFDNKVALNQLYRGQRALHNHSALVHNDKPPRIITLGGDHTITLMALRSAYENFGKVSVIHFDSHLDTWDPKIIGGNISKRAGLNHGTFLHFAHENGYIEDDTNIHVGIRAPYIAPGFYDEDHDFECGFDKIVARDLDIISLKEVVSDIKKRVGNGPVYISVDIDVVDVASAPGTGTPETGGLSSRELLTILDGLEGLNVIGADIVEVLPAFDTNADITALIAAQVVDSFLGLMTVDSVKN